MNIIPIIKLGAGVVTSFGAGAVVGNVIKATTPENIKRTQKILIGIGGFTLAAAAGELASRYVEESIQGAADSVRVGRATADLLRKGFKHGAEEAAEATSEYKTDLKNATKDYFEGVKDAATEAKDIVEDGVKEDPDAKPQD